MGLPAHEQARRYRATFELAPVGNAHLSPDGTFLWVNGRLCEMIGYTREELLGRAVRDVTDPDFLAADAAYIQALLAGERASYAVEKRYVRKDGMRLWAELTAIARRTRRGCSPGRQAGVPWLSPLHSCRWYGTLVLTAARFGALSGRPGA
jgi:PAS domain S-box-containing protein